MDMVNGAQIFTASRLRLWLVSLYNIKFDSNKILFTWEYVTPFFSIQQKWLQRLNKEVRSVSYYGFFSTWLKELSYWAHYFLFALDSNGHVIIFVFLVLIKRKIMLQIKIDMNESLKIKQHILFSFKFEHILQYLVYFFSSIYLLSTLIF